MAVELNQSHRRLAKGFSLIELLVAMLVLGTAVFAHVGLHGQMFLEMQSAQRHLLAQQIALEWLHYVEFGVIDSGREALAAGPPPAINLSCLNRYCARSQIAAYQAALVKCQIAQYAQSPGCVLVRDRDALLPLQQTVRLPAGEVTADGVAISVTWEQTPQRRVSLIVGGWR